VQAEQDFGFEGAAEVESDAEAGRATSSRSTLRGESPGASSDSGSVAGRSPRDPPEVLVTTPLAEASPPRSQLGPAAVVPAVPLDARVESSANSIVSPWSVASGTPSSAVSETPRSGAASVPGSVPGSTRNRPGSRGASNASGTGGTGSQPLRLPPRAPPKRTGSSSQQARERSTVVEEGSVATAQTPQSSRAHSEPPAPARQGGGRLAKVVEEVLRHLQDGREDPSDAKGWLHETAQLELFAEEMRWLITEQEAKDPEEPQERRARGRQPTGTRKHELSVLRGDKDLRWARQQLRTLEREHAHLTQLLSSSNPAVQQQQMDELRRIERQVKSERKRQKNLATENRERARSLVRGAGDQGDGGDGNARALQQIERLEAELGVLKVKNASLQKQIDEERAQLRRAREHRDVIDQKAQQVAEKLGNEEVQAQLAEQRAQDELVKNEVAELRRALAELQDQRRRSCRNHERILKEGAREHAVLKEQCVELESKRSWNERSLQLHQRQRQRHRESPRPSSRPQSSDGNGARRVRGGAGRRKHRSPSSGVSPAAAAAGRRPPPAPLQAADLDPPSRAASTGASPAGPDAAEVDQSTRAASARASPAGLESDVVQEQDTRTRGSTDAAGEEQDTRTRGSTDAAGEEQDAGRIGDQGRSRREGCMAVNATTAPSEQSDAEVETDLSSVEEDSRSRESAEAVGEDRALYLIKQTVFETLHRGLNDGSLHDAVTNFLQDDK